MRLVLVDRLLDPCLVSEEGFEPPTSALGVRHSVQLNYSESFAGSSPGRLLLML